jgi:hypothetical protein
MLVYVKWEKDTILTIMDLLKDGLPVLRYVAVVIAAN